MKGNPVKEVNFHKHLGVYLQKDCFWKTQIEEIVNIVSPMINCLKRFKYRLTRYTLECMYTYFILPNFEYCCHLWDNCTKEQSMMLEYLYLDAMQEQSVVPLEGLAMKSHEKSGDWFHTFS